MGAGDNNERNNNQKDQDCGGVGGKCNSKEGNNNESGQWHQGKRMNRQRCDDGGGQDGWLSEGKDTGEHRFAPPIQQSTLGNTLGRRGQEEETTLGVGRRGGASADAILWKLFSSTKSIPNRCSAHPGAARGPRPILRQSREEGCPIAAMIGSCLEPNWRTH